MNHENLATQRRGKLRKPQPIHRQGQLGTLASAGSRSMASTMARQPEARSTIHGVFFAEVLRAVSM